MLRFMKIAMGIMAAHARNVTTCWPVVTVLFLCTACTGISEKQLALDPIIVETQRAHDFVLSKYSEFSQLKNEYAKSKQAAYLERMSELMELVRDELERAEYFQNNYRYYRKGIDYGRWKSAGDTFSLCRKTLCEMMLGIGELHMVHGDKEYAAALFAAVVSGFEEEEISRYVERARTLLREMEQEGFCAASIKSVHWKTL